VFPQSPSPFYIKRSLQNQWRSPPSCQPCLPHCYLHQGGPFWCQLGREW
jgi:hypothetical protein